MSAANQNLLGVLPADLVAFLESRGERCSLTEARRVLSRLITEGSTDPTPRREPRKALLAALREHTNWQRLEVVERFSDEEGKSVRYLYRSPDGALSEAVRIGLHKPDQFTACLSSQVGCAMQRAFCATGRLGLTRNPASWGIDAALVRDLACEACAPSSPIDQIVLLTHNVHFHHTVTQGLEQRLKKQITWWSVRKHQGVTALENHKGNPVRTTYHRLWEEYFRDRQAPQPPQGPPNTMRRILEYWFKTLSNVAMHEITLGLQLSEADAAVAASLVPWTNDHSHACFDEARPDLRPEPCERYAVVFERIFEGHSPSHLRAMRSLLDPPAAGSAANGPPA